MRTEVVRNSRLEPDSVSKEADILPLSIPTLAEIFESHAAFVMRTVRRMGAMEADVEDISREVFIIVEKKLPTFVASPHR